MIFVLLIDIMTEYVYRYDISIFENGYEPVQLCKEIDSDPNIVKNVDRINTDMSNQVLELYFLEELNPDEKIALDLVVQNHVPIERSDYEFDTNIDMLNNRIVNLGAPIDDTDGTNKFYVDEHDTQAEQNARGYTDQIASDILEGRLDFNEAQLDINKLSNIPAGGLAGLTARQTLERKTINADQNTLLNIGNNSIKDGARIDATKIGDGLVNNNEFKRLAGITSNVQEQINQANAQTEAHSNRTNNPHNVTKAQVGLSNLENIKSNYSSVRIPNNLDDRLSGYSIGSFWFNRITNVGYVCADNTEMDAKWLEITSLGEITQGLNVGNGVGIYMDKVGAVHRFRSIIPGNNVTIQQASQDITIKSKDSHSFLLSPIEIEIIADEYRGILFFPWLRTEFGVYRQGKLIFEAVVPSGSMSIRLRKITENSILGELSQIDASGFYELDVANPPDNARVKVEVKKADIETAENPRIYGIVLKYQT